MLTKDDLSQIKVIVQEETGKIVQDKTRKIFKEEIDPLKKDVKELKSDVKTLKNDVSKIRKDMGTMVSFFDREYLDLRDIPLRRVRLGCGQV